MQGQAQQSLRHLECKSLCSGLQALKNETETTPETSHLTQIQSSANWQATTNSAKYLLWNKEIRIVIIFIKLFLTPIFLSSGSRIHNNHTAMHSIFSSFSFSSQTETLTIPKAKDAKDEGAVQQGTSNQPRRFLAYTDDNCLL